MNLLLDTHAALWWWGDPARLSARARDAMSGRDHQCYFSAASGYELAHKQRLRPGLLPASFLTELPALVTAEEWLPLPLNLEHTLRAGRFPVPHRDPFDRLIAAQAVTENLIVVTVDERFGDFGVRTLW